MLYIQQILSKTCEHKLDSVDLIDMVYLIIGNH